MLHLRLFVTGAGAASQHAIAELEVLRREALPAECRVDVVDVLEEPALAERHRVYATPMLVRVSPLPIRRFVGNLADGRRVLATLDLI